MRRRFINSANSVPLSFEALEDGFSLSFINDVLYSIDGGAWETLPAREYTEEINSGSVISFKHVTSLLGLGNVGVFYINKKCNVFGNCGSLIPKALGEKYISDNLFYQLFYGCSGIVDASKLELPATTLAYQCYLLMFKDCTSLVNAPALPATTLADYCYDSMFEGCTSLTNAPTLSATTLADNCYSSMFSGCTSLVTAPELPATTLAYGCYDNMFNGCTSLTTAPELPATTLAPSCYQNMFEGCTSLTTAPELPATILKGSCYYRMFYYCHKLNYIKMLATDIPDYTGNRCLTDWVYGVSSTGTFVKNSAMTTLPTGANGIPSGWTIVDDGEESGGSSLTFPVNLVKGDNGEIGKLVFEYCKENPNKELPNGGIILTAEYGNIVYTLNLIKSAYMTSGNMVTFTGTYNGIYWFINLNSDGILYAHQD